MNKPLIIFLLFFTAGAGLASAQQQSESAQNGHKLSISATGEAVVPADIATMSINISIHAADADSAFMIHKKREQFLSTLLQELNFEDEQISYQPITIRPDRQRNGSIHSATSQRVQLQLSDIELLSELQMTLIQNGFDNFSGNLSSTKLEKAGNDALRLAISNARQDAEILADAAGKSIGNVVSIEHSSNISYRPASRSETVQALSSMADMGPSMFDFSQTVRVQKRVSVIFELNDQ